MIKLKNSIQNLVKSAIKQINQLEIRQAIKIHSNQINLFIDIRDIREIKNSRHSLGAKHLLGDMLEFWIDPNSPYYKEFFRENFILYRASDWRSTLAYLKANNIELLNTSHLISGFIKWLELKRPIEEIR